MQNLILRRLNLPCILASTLRRGRAATSSRPPAPATPAAPASPAAPAAPAASLSGASLWPVHWTRIEAMRRTRAAPVDVMGATALAYGAGYGASPSAQTAQSRASFRFRTLIATMLSPQTKDAQTAQAFNNLERCAHAVRSGYEGFTAASLLQVPEKDLLEACAPVSFYKTKAAHIRRACEVIEKQAYTYTTAHGDGEGEGQLEAAGIPTDVEELLSYAGVGPKIAYLTFSIAWGRDEGICVDTHVHRIANRLRWVGAAPKRQKQKGVISSEANANANANADAETEAEAEAEAELVGPAAAVSASVFVDTSNAEKTRLQLQQLLPRDRWGLVNELLVGFGQTVCRAQAPRCQECSVQETCAWYQNQAKAKLS